MKIEIGSLTDVEKVLDDEFSNAKLCVVDIKGNLVGGKLWDLVE